MFPGPAVFARDRAYFFFSPNLYSVPLRRRWILARCIQTTSAPIMAAQRVGNQITSPRYQHQRAVNTGYSTATVILDRLTIRVEKAGEAPLDKPTFGSCELGQLLKAQDDDLKKQGELGIESITLIGLCTDICVISNAMIVKAFLPEVPVKVDAACCAGVTPESHKNALEAMKVCQIEIERDII